LIGVLLVATAASSEICGHSITSIAMVNFFADHEIAGTCTKRNRGVAHLHHVCRDDARLHRRGLFLVCAPQVGKVGPAHAQFSSRQPSRSCLRIRSGRQRGRERGGHGGVVSVTPGSARQADRTFSKALAGPLPWPAMQQSSSLTSETLFLPFEYAC
jgi:hypothetical protein